MRWLPSPELRCLVVSTCLLIALGPSSVQGWQEGKSDDEPMVPRVLAPQRPQPISRAAAERSEPATVVIQDSSGTPAPPIKSDNRILKPPAAAPSVRVETPPPASVSEPVPETQPDVVIEASKLKGIQPGVSTMAQVRAGWGEPENVQKFEKHVEHRYRLEPFDKVVIGYQRETVATIVVYLKAAVKAEAVAAQLGINDLAPAMVTDAAGGLLGQVYPERAVLFSFQPNANELLVSQIVLEPISPQPFSLRAESRLTTHWSQGLKDVDQAIKLDPGFARAHWLKAQLLAAAGRSQEAVTAAEEAVRIDPANVEFRLTRARIYQACGDYSRATAETKLILARPSLAGVIKARALCLLADLAASGPGQDYQAAVKYRQDATALADAVMAERSNHRAAAREVLLEAHLGTAHDIAWGPWQRKPEVVPKWLSESKSIAQLDQPEVSVARSRRMRIARAALGALAGMQGELDPSEWVTEMEDATRQLLQATDDPLRRGQIHWELALAYYDAVQIDHARGDAAQAMRHSGKAIESLSLSTAHRPQTTDHKYLLGRVYFRTGAVHAVLKSNHAQALTWYERALPLLRESASAAAPIDVGRHGESLVSMAVTYWEAGQRTKAVDLTTQGLQMMQQAVGQKLLDESTLSVPYANLAHMHRRLGDLQTAGKYAQMASRLQGGPK